MKTPTFLLFTCLLLQTPALAAESATAVVSSVEKNLAPKDFEARYEFTNFRTDGTVMRYEVLFTVHDVDNSHGYFVKPEREKGREMLRQNNVLWTFVPSVGRAVRIADRDSFAGGDFSNADVLRVDWLNQYTAEMAKDSPNQWIIDLTAKTGDAAYAKMRLWVNKKDSQPVQQYFYDSSGTLLKRLLYGSPKTFGSITRPSRQVMENVITHQKSEMKILELSLGRKAPASRFTVEGLGK